MRLTLICCLIVGVAVRAQDGGDQIPLDIRLSTTLQRVGPPAVSPDGRRVIYTVTSDNIDGNNGRTQLYLSPLVGATDSPQQLAPPESTVTSQTNPFWITNQLVGYAVKSKTNGTVLWSQAIDSSAAPVRLGSFPTSIRSLRYSAAAQRLVILADLYQGTTMEETVARDLQEASRLDTAKVFDQLMIRHWDSWTTEKSATLLAVPLTHGDGDDNADDDSSPPQLGENPVNLLQDSTLGRLDIDSFSLSPDGQWAAFNAKYPSPTVSWTTDIKVFLLSTTGTGAARPTVPSLRSLTDHHHGATSSAVFSRDSRFMAWLYMDRPQYESDHNNIIVYDLTTGSRRAVAADWPISPSRIEFSRDGHYLIALAENQGKRGLYTIDLRPKAENVVAIPVDPSVISFAPTATGSIAFTGSRWAHPTEMFVVHFTDTESDVHRLTTFNDAKLAPTFRPTVEKYWFPGARNASIQGMLIKPLDWSAEKTYPLLVMVHGGPQSSWSDTWSNIWNPYLYAGAGYAVWLVNPSGSTGYGQNLTDSIHAQWGGTPYQDLMHSVDFLAREFAWIDTDRMCAMGGSYGGYMVNWINGQTNRFKCLVNHAGPFSMMSMYYTTDELWFNEYEFDGPPFEARSRPFHERWSPINFVQRWRTPTLVSQGSKDYRVPEGEGIASFTALQRRGVPSRLMYFVDEGHSITKPPNMVKFVDEVLQWISTYNPISQE
ncbi:dipeptidylpeptidase [Dimargaris cristalligena]|nr:dipeptidylpeptidase [Dimargaris cristalligena]